MLIFVSGSSGFLGGHLCNELSKQGHTVHGLDKDLPINCTVKLDRFIQMDLLELDKPGDHSWLEQYDIIYHLAAETGLGASDNWLTDIDPYWKVNTKATLNLIKYSKPEKFIFTSTAALYGEGQHFREKDPLNCNNGYGFSKAVAETIIVESGTPYCIFRPGTIVGPYGRSVLNRFVYDCVKGKQSTVYNHGYNKRCFIDVEDVVSALIAGMDYGGVFNLCRGEADKVGDVLDVIAEVGREYNYLYDHKRVKFYPPGLAKTVTMNNDKLMKKGWPPKVSTKHMVQRLFEHYLNDFDALPPSEWR